MTQTLEGRTISILCGTGFKKLELTEPRAEAICEVLPEP